MAFPCTPLFSCQGTGFRQHGLTRPSTEISDVVRAGEIDLLRIYRAEYTPEYTVRLVRLCTKAAAILGATVAATSLAAPGKAEQI